MFFFGVIFLTLRFVTSFEFYEVEYQLYYLNIQLENK